MRACRVIEVLKAEHGWFYWTDAEPGGPANWTSFEVSVGDVAYVSNAGGGLLESDIVRRVKDYLAATEGEK